MLVQMSDRETLHPSSPEATRALASTSKPTPEPTPPAMGAPPIDLVAHTSPTHNDPPSVLDLEDSIEV